MTVSLMYHAIPRDAAHSGGWDAHYAVMAARFKRQIALLQSAGLGVTSVRRALDAVAAGNSSMKTVCLTFDDGTCTDAEVATPILTSAGVSADFFVNPGTVGSDGYVTWAQLRWMADQGMSIQSHSQDHRFLDELSMNDLRDSLLRSKSEIEHNIGRPVTLLAPPGGRLPSRAITLAREIGYEAICSSRPGRWRAGDGPVLPRVAVLAEDPDDTVKALGQGAPRHLLPKIARYSAGWLAKKMLGNGRYAIIREKLV